MDNFTDQQKDIVYLSILLVAYAIIVIYGILRKAWKAAESEDSEVEQG